MGADSFASRSPLPGVRQQRCWTPAPSFSNTRFRAAPAARTWPAVKQLCSRCRRDATAVVRSA